MTPDTDALLATVREALTIGMGTIGEYRHEKGHAALDSLAAELERLTLPNIARDQLPAIYANTLARAEAAEEELERLQNKLNTDSQNFELEARKAQIASLEAELERVKQAFNTEVRVCSERTKMLERVKAERDTCVDNYRACSDGHVTAVHRAQAAEARLDKALSALREIQAVQPKRIAWFREHGIVFDKAPGGDDRWQNIAFQIYTDDCEVETIARAAIAEIEGEAT